MAAKTISTVVLRTNGTLTTFTLDRDRVLVYVLACIVAGAFIEVSLDPATGLTTYPTVVDRTILRAGDPLVSTHVGIACRIPLSAGQILYCRDDGAGNGYLNLCFEG